MMELDLIQQSWQELRRYINTIDRSEAAEGLVSVLIDNGIDAEDIASAFTGDADIKSAVSVYFDDPDPTDDYDEIDFDDD